MPSSPGWWTAPRRRYTAVCRARPLRRSAQGSALARSLESFRYLLKLQARLAFDPIATGVLDDLADAGFGFRDGRDTAVVLSQVFADADLVKHGADLDQRGRPSVLLETADHRQR